ncbi:two-component system, regulatory protein [Calothrix sp. NIES-4071]|nr:two-component system, regulatory protein [Calothrix sp. NIES-4071]BAZ61161.1 two-component system, regulatory protein [Calothrix sp. NIES-4105]
MPRLNLAFQNNPSLLFGDKMELAREFMNDNKVQSLLPPLILAVEDNEDNLVLMRYALDAVGCRSICLQDSYSTVVLAKEHQPDLILLDILLPGLSGIDIIKLLKREPLTYDIPVVAVTALAGAEDRERILFAGFDDYLSKPFMIEEFESKIYHHLHRKLNPRAGVN